jgi:hypothetical protein
MRPELFSRYRGRFELAASRGGEVARDHRIAGRSVRLRAAGPGVAAALGRALAPLADDGAGPPELTIHAWDSASTQTPMLEPGWALEAFGRARGELDAHAAYHVGSDVLSLFDPERGEAIWWTRDAAALPSWELGAPMRTVFHFWAASRGLCLVHGAAVGGPGGAVLVTARGGSGKSSTAVACFLDGLGYLGDDYVLVGGDPPSAHLLYGSAKLDDGDAARFPALAACAGDHRRAAGDKLVFYLHELHRDRLVRGAPLARLLVPRFAAGEATRTAQASRGEIMSALAPSTLFQQSGAGAAELRLLAAVVRRVPGGALELGRDRAAVPAAIRALLDGARP